MAASIKYTFLLWLLSISLSHSQTDSIAASQLQEVIISSMHVNDSLLRAPASIGVLSEADLQRNNLADIAPAVNLIAGVFMQSGSWNTNRISIRGIGARTPFGTNKIRAFYGNIPLTSGDSETTIEDIDIENIERVEIIKGPLSSVYGAGLGGAILIEPKLDGTPGHGLRLSTTYGSFGLMKTSAAYGFDAKTGSLNLSYHLQEAEGWRQNSSYRREGVTLAGTLFRRSKSKLTYFGNFTEMLAYIPSSIDRQTFLTNPQAAAFTWNAAKGYEQYKSMLGGLSYDWQLSDNISNATSVFANVKDGNEPRPFDILKQYTTAYGVRTQFIGKFGGTRILAGVELFRDNYDAQTFENLYADNDGNGSLAGDLLSDTQQHRDLINIFSQILIPISGKLSLQGGVNLNQTRFSIDEAVPVDSGEQQYKYDFIISPQISLSYKLSGLQTIYVSASHGFSMPAIEETLRADGTINPNIKPENGYNLEIGSKSYFLNKSLYTEISLYRMAIADLLVAQRVADDQYVGVNAGKTLHQGVELTLQYNKRIGRFLTIAPFAAVSAGRYTFEEFVNNDVDYSGNKLTGVPANKINAGIALSNDGGLYCSIDFQYVDDFPIDDANSVYNSAYRLWNLKTGYRFSVFKDLSAQLAAGVNNVFDEQYASMVLVNATAFGSASPRYYYPGLPVNYYANFSVNYRF